MVCFQAAGCLQSFVDHYFILTHKYNSTTFNSIWSSTMTCARRSNRDMTVSDVGPRVWEPTFAQCRQILEELNSASITLASVDKNFEQYRMQTDNLKHEIYILSKGVSECLQVPSKSAWISNIVNWIQQYWSLCDHREAANSFLRLRDALNLTGDFKDVERISEEVIFFPVVLCDVIAVIYMAYVYMFYNLLCR